MTGNKSAPTLDDVAKLAGVSTATVSRCLNMPDRVVEKTRKRVQWAIDQLGYTPNFGARVMAAKRTFTIGAIIPTMENSIFARGLQAFQEVLHQKGYTLLVASSAYSPEIEEEQIRVLVSRGADGLLLIGHDRDPSIYRFLEQRNVPALVAWAHSETAVLPSVGFDNRTAMRAMAEEVLKQGHHRIGIISGLTQGNDRARQRIDGIMDAVTSAGQDPADLAIIETPYDIESGGEAFEKLMSQATPPTAVLCGNDVLAAGALRRALGMGMAVPGDVSITGFDDIELAGIVAPALTTVHVPHRDMGLKAAAKLVELVEGNDIEPSSPLDTTLRIRESLGPAAA